MTIRAKITLWVLLVGLSEAILLGLIGYNSVAALARNAVELRKISAALSGARELNASLIRLSDPSRLLQGGDPARFERELGDLRRQVGTCSATTCHGYAKRPPGWRRT